MTVTQLAASEEPNAASTIDIAARIVFVGESEVEEGPLGSYKSCGKRRGFAFFVYKTKEGAGTCLAELTKTVDDTKCSTSRPTSRP
ncbi:hypothetical protein PIB30_021815 [Stylosanthes scabra]|uniref:RRM domain-containing protein n=1 Tax=Stylosanthes scabra TaxID=79078 RepID=A0ABU6X8W4_9FABA|nr:hypothetical protein [Stylosanthes scabra]